MRHFEEREFACKCGCGNGFDQMNPQFVVNLDKARGLSESPYVLTSAFRCESHNMAVGGVPDSSHTKGFAVDIRTRNSKERFEILFTLMSQGFSRIGIAREFIHVDVDPAKTPEVVWLY